MNVSERYQKLAAELGDVEYKLTILREKRNQLIEQVKQLDALAGMLKEANVAAKAQAPKNPA